MTDVPPEKGTIMELLERDHRVLRAMLGRFDTTATDEWTGVFRDLVDHLVRHEVAEQEVVFPRLRRVLPDLAKTLEECVADEERLERHLVSMARLPVLSPEFRDALAKLRDELDAHLAREDLVVLPKLRTIGHLDDEDFARSYEVARMGAPSRPEAIVGGGEPVEGLFGRLRQAIGRD